MSLPPKSQRSRPWRDSTAGFTLGNIRLEIGFRTIRHGDIRGNGGINSFIKEMYYESKRIGKNDS
jgi:hypothetical protein